jgi:hypothetical protein
MKMEARYQVPLKCWYPTNSLHSIIYQKTTILNTKQLIPSKFASNQLSNRDGPIHFLNTFRPRGVYILRPIYILASQATSPVAL